MSTTKAEQSLVILGAGVIGLTIAYLASLAEDVSFKIVVIARELPSEGMDSQAWASPYAGANWSPMELGSRNERIRKWEKRTFDKLWDMIPTGMVKMLPTKVYNSTRDAPDLWWKDIVRDLRVLPSSDIPEPFKSGAAFNTVSVNPPEYISWLQSELISRGVTFERRNVRSLDELRGLVGTDGILVNASSLGSKSIIGVQDAKLYPIRGQAIVVQAPGLQECLMAHSETEEATYIIPRPGIGQPDTALLGGTFQRGNWDTSLDMEIAKGIFNRCAAVAPCLKSAESKILKHNVGLRPAREGGPRVEVERITVPLQNTHTLTPWHESNTDIHGNERGSMVVVHAYGFGPAGYQRSWGAAEEAVALIKAQVALKQS